MTLPQEGHLLRIFIGESDRHEGQPLYRWIVKEARRAGLAGATAFRGIEGFGGRSLLHTTKFLRLSSDLPVVVEIIDTMDKIEAFLPTVDRVVDCGLATVEKAHIRFYRGGGHDD